MVQIPTNIDKTIQSYDVETDPVLTQEFAPIMDKLWHDIESYGLEVNEYGAVLSKHLIRTSMIGREFLTRELGFSEAVGRNFYDANLLQDLGKIHPDYTDPTIWSLPHRPSEEERCEKRLHPARGNDLLDRALEDASDELKNHPHIKVIKAIQLYHHERVDGTGQNSVKGNDMGDIIKAICIIDTFDGDMIHRPHQRAERTPERALERMQTNTKYDGTFDLKMLQRFVDFTLKPS